MFFYNGLSSAMEDHDVSSKTLLIGFIVWLVTLGLASLLLMVAGSKRWRVLAIPFLVINLVLIVVGIGAFIVFLKNLVGCRESES